MSKFVKNLIVTDLENRVGDNRDFLVIDSSRLDANTTNRFRLELRRKNIHALTVRNSLARRALHNLGMEALDPVLEGPSTLVWGGEDIVALSKEITRWAKELKELEIKGGAVEGTTLDAAAVDQLSKSPGRLELIGQIAGLILSPGARLAGALLGPARTLAGQIKAVEEKEESAAD